VHKRNVERERERPIELKVEGQKGKTQGRKETEREINCEREKYVHRKKYLEREREGGGRRKIL